ncbi:YebC/PmpR family DNA-binding transcriptional regulator [Shouchella shacheensis]|uniref:YebC/PmpR family DNA-binding transcriptional regulator n=1 Tax=Shouchella shacheensis TaxID=1649580 RepID=UPI00073FB64D|nr:YebC/PmpR family DNA-binding transcriptional regulator [Shouchella shacheensis]
MAGHSKWKNIQHRKGRQDAAKGKIFTKLSKEIFAAVRSAGDDPTTNTRLRLAIAKAKDANMPNDNIDRTIKKASGDTEGVSYEELTYEGYGPGGAAVMVEVLTDNKNRSAAEVRLAFNKNGGNLGENGCVSFLFERKGFLILDREKAGISEDELMLAVIEAGADELESSENEFEVMTAPDEFESVKSALEEQGFTFLNAEVTQMPQTYAELARADAENMIKLIDMLEDNDDVQNVYHNFELMEEHYEN